MSNVFDLSQEERKLVNENIDFYTSLSSGKKKPCTDAQRHFIAVCKGKAQAETIHELAYMKYRIELIASRKKEKESNNSNLLEQEPNRPTEGWFTNSDWNKMHPDRSR